MSTTDTEREPATPPVDTFSTVIEEGPDVEPGTSADVDAEVDPADGDDVAETLDADRPGAVGRVVAELRQVTWPTRRELVTYSLVVLTFLVAVTAAVAGVDALFGAVVLRLLG